jgi:hypothetical protein
MKIVKEVKTIEVKRTYVIADYVAHVHKGKKLGNNRTFLKDLDEKELVNKLASVKERILKLKEKELDKLITPEWTKRVKSYNSSQWYLAEVSPKEVGVWKRAGGLPLRWTNRSLAETAEKVARGLKRNSKSIKRRPKHTIPNILKTSLHLEQKEKYLYPIVFKSDTGTKGRKRLKMKMKGDIDDGCMRSIALAISGRNPITVYFGVPKEV